MHGALFYIVVAIGTPAILVALAVASRQRWACTIMAASTRRSASAFLWILPLVRRPSRSSGRCTSQVTHFIPWEFPLLLIVPALVVDLILQRTDGWRPIVARAGRPATAFLAAFIAVQWPFANFLMTPLARNRFFGTRVLRLQHAARGRCYARYRVSCAKPTRGAVLARHADRASLVVVR